MIFILPGVVLDDKQKKVIFAIQDVTTMEGVALTVTRGHSTPAQQLSTIEDYARKNNCLFTEFIPGDATATIKLWRGGQEIIVYAWQQTWSMLLFKGIVVNPPFKATCLEHYIRPSGEDMFMKMIDASPHTTSDPIDFSAKIDRGMTTEKEDIDVVEGILKKAQANGSGIRFIKPEPKNVCVHIDLA